MTFPTLLHLHLLLKVRVTLLFFMAYFVGIVHMSFAGYTMQRTSLNKSVVSILPKDVENPRSSESNTLPIPLPKRSRAEEQPSDALAIGDIPCSSTQNNQSSPKAPSTLLFPSQCDNFVFQQMIPLECSLIPSKKVILISPYKKKTGSYSGERNHHHVSISPLKSCPDKLVKRDHVKNRLNFECLEF